jgi:Kef-type K+ transport system membrane component KefB/nucleotide-binding universal stress UspA family protein
MWTNIIPELPFKEPVIVFTLLITIILVAPIVFRKFRIPGIIGLIVSGMVIGPHSLNLVEFGESIKLLSTAGLLYLMFLAGLELNARDLLRNGNKSLVFGALTFFIPLTFGFIVAHFILSYNLLASLLIASMFSTHTLISYPIASRLGITRTEAVTVSIGGTIITDTAVLLLLAFISAASEGSISAVFWIRMTLSIAAFSFLILWGVPKLSIWFFKNLEGESGSHYIFVLAMLFISGLLSRAAGIEPIIGAFLAGLAMSNVIPHTSALMNRISFIGNNFFIPIFLISVGLMVDFTVFFTGFGALVFAVSLVIVAISSKYVAAWLTQIIYKYSSTERQVIFGMSVSHAAAIIAVVIVGYNLKLIGLDVLNGAIMIILVSCFIGSFVTEKYGRKLAIIETDKVPAKISSPEQILVSVSNPATIEGLIDFALLIREKKASQPMYMLSVVPDDDFAEDQIVKNNKMFQSAISHAAAAETELSLVSRVDINVANGISRAVKELMVNKIVLGWNGKSTTTNFFFGSIIENLISNSEQMVLVVKITNTLNSLKRIIVVIPENAEREAGFENWVSTLKILSSRTSSSLLFVGFEKSLASIRKFLDIKSDSGNIVFQTTKSTHPIIEQTQIINEMDLLIVISARRRTLSFSHYLDHMPRDMARYFEKNSFIIIYPEQRIVKTQTLSSSLDGIEVSPIQENIDRFSHIGNFKRKSPDTRHNSITE